MLELTHFYNLEKCKKLQRRALQSKKGLGLYAFLV